MLQKLNLLLRFLLEICALVASGIWAYETFSSSKMQWFLTFLVPSLLMVLWGTFNVVGDPSRSGHAPIKVRGWFRLFVEAFVFGFGAWSLFTIKYDNLASVYIGLLVFHYTFSFKRLSWLLKQ